MTQYYPAFLNLEGKRVLLFGGGAVALRKAKALVRSGACINAIAKEFSPSFLKFSEKNGITAKHGSTVPENLKSFPIVVAATSDAHFNHKVYDACVKKGILVNVVDDPKHSTFIVPSVVKRGALQIAISTGGRSPLLAKMLRKKLERQLGIELGQLVETLGLARAQAKQTISSQKKRRNHFKKLIERSGVIT